jgi:hypothetical protein
MEENEAITAMIAVLETCEANAPSLEEQLMVLSLAWLERAQRLRSDALAVPNGFPDEQARQLRELEKITALVRGDAPDLELERLFHEGDLEGVWQHLRNLQKGGAG